MYWLSPSRIRPDVYQEAKSGHVSTHEERMLCASAFAAHVAVAGRSWPANIKMIPSRRDLDMAHTKLPRGAIGQRIGSALGMMGESTDKHAPLLGMGFDSMVAVEFAPDF